MSVGIKGKKISHEVVYDFAKHAGAIGAIDLSDPSKFGGNAPLPDGMIVQSLTWRTLTALTSGGAATVALGDAASAAVYLAATAFNDAKFGLDAVAAGAIGMPRLVSSANIAKPQLTIAAATLTAGKIALVFEGYIAKNGA
jgi:hypothetical protein